MDSDNEKEHCNWCQKDFPKMNWNPKYEEYFDICFKNLLGESDLNMCSFCKMNFIINLDFRGKIKFEMEGGRKKINKNFEKKFDCIETELKFYRENFIYEMLNGKDEGEQSEEGEE